MNRNELVVLLWPFLLLHVVEKIGNLALSQDFCNKNQLADDLGAFVSDLLFCLRMLGNSAGALCDQHHTSLPPRLKAAPPAQGSSLSLRHAAKVVPVREWFLGFVSQDSSPSR